MVKTNYISARELRFITKIIFYKTLDIADFLIKGSK